MAQTKRNLGQGQPTGKGTAGCAANVKGGEQGAIMGCTGTCGSTKEVSNDEQFTSVALSSAALFTAAVVVGRTQRNCQLPTHSRHEI